MKITIAPQALDDISGAITYLHERNPQAAAALSDRLFEIIDRLANGEFEGPESVLRSTHDRVPTESTTGATTVSSSCCACTTPLAGPSQE